MNYFRYCFLVATLLYGASALWAADAPGTPVFASGTCLGAPDGAQNWPGYCDKAQKIHDNLKTRTRTAPVELRELKSLLWENDDRDMWRFLSLSLAEASPYFSSPARRLALMDEIESSMDKGGRADEFVNLAINIIRALETGDAERLNLFIGIGRGLLQDEKNRHLLALLGSSMIKLAQFSASRGGYDDALEALTLCEQASDAWGNPLMPQRCYNLLRLSGNEPETFLAEVAAREERLTCGRSLRPLCNLFHKSGHGQYLPAAEK